MSDSKNRTNLHKGARVINAAIGELDLPDDFKRTAQQVVTLFATDLLPGLWPRKPERDASQPTARGGPPAGTTPEEAAQLDSLRKQIVKLIDDDDDDEEVAAAPSEAPEKADAPPVWESDMIKMVRCALETFHRAHANHLHLVNEALAAATHRGADPMDILEVLLHATDYRLKDPTVPTLAALTSRATRRDVH